jgi:hypothetical protein
MENQVSQISQEKIDESIGDFEITKLKEGIPQLGLPRDFLKERRNYQLEMLNMTTTDEEFEKIKKNCIGLDVRKEKDHKKFCDEIMKLEYEINEDNENDLPDINKICTNYDGTTWFFVEKNRNNIWIFDTTKDKKCEIL